MGYGKEVDMIRIAHDLGLLTCPYVFNEGEAKDMAGPAPTCSFRTWG